jgi:ubiquinone/menaquinone biosynthesis C-methylase UbiE
MPQRRARCPEAGKPARYFAARTFSLHFAVPISRRLVSNPLVTKLATKYSDQWLYSPLLTKLSTKYLYPLSSRVIGDVQFLDWAYEEDPPMALPLEASDEPNRAHINLYHRTATQADLSGKRVLEVSCGHGGGASYLVRTLRPASYTGLDLNPNGIAFCRKRHNLPSLDFVQGNAEDLPFDDQSFDAVLNVEASHLYPHFPRFLAEVARVLRPGGHFLYTDVRPRAAVAEWEAALAEGAMRLISKRDINEEVMRGIQTSQQETLALLGPASRRVPSFLRDLARQVGELRASTFHESLRSGENSYQMYCFDKN